MSEDFAKFLQLAGLVLWNLFPNGTMILASWLCVHELDLMPQEEDEDEVWIPHYGK